MQTSGPLHFIESNWAELGTKVKYDGKGQELCLS